MENNLRELREDAAITMSDLAHMCNISYPVIQKIETSNHVPRLDAAYKISKILNKPLTAIWPNSFKIRTETVSLRKISEDA
jgi:DNA-binding XRE family transcriptional regulator